MPTHIEWSSIALRLALTAIASAAIGLNRGEHNRPVGLRTTMLVALAAAISMIQVNLLLPITGKSADLYVVLDLMRLPLGILSGMGFIGAGAIVRRNNLVQGVTTAATLWFITVMGLCFGGGQLVLGLAAMALALFILWCLKWVEERVEWERRAELRIAFETGAAVEQQILPRLVASGFSVKPGRILFDSRGQVCAMRYDIAWRAAQPARTTPEAVRELARAAGVLRLDWRPLERQ
jgi:putative Mg2+ transporter-C (MgtC) family protein